MKLKLLLSVLGLVLPAAVAQRIRGATADISKNSAYHQNGRGGASSRQIRQLKRRSGGGAGRRRYARLLVDEFEEALMSSSSDPDAQYGDLNHRRLPPSKVSKACSSKSLKGSKESSTSGGKAGKGGKGSSKSKNRPSCDNELSFCSCPDCTQEVLDRMAGEYTCGDRMEYLLNHYSGAFAKTRQACARVAGLEFPDVCGECDPNTCQGRKPDEPEFYCGCETCNNEVWDRDTGGYSCGARISWAMIVDQDKQAAACAKVADEHPKCAQCNPETCTAKVTPTPAPVTPEPSQLLPIDGAAYCSCPSCTQEVWDADTGDNVTCGARVEWLEANKNMSEAGACALIAADEFPSVCGACDPSTCNGSPTAAPAVSPLPAPSGATPTGQTPTAPTAPGSPAPTAEPSGSEFLSSTEPSGFAPSPEAPGPSNPVPTPSTPVAPVTTPPAPTPSALAPSPSSVECEVLTPESDLYCFQSYSQRTAYDGVWGAYRVEVKRSQDDTKCAPNDNRFSNDTVTLEGEDLTLRFKKTSGGWLSSEVRVVMPESKLYTYGQYEFSVKSVVVRNHTSLEVLDEKLPPELVLGMFTFDPRENCQVTLDTYRREVDVELSNWGFGGNSSWSSNATTNGNGSATDGMFVVQPPEDTQVYRFYTGSDEDYDQGGHTYGFYWHPTNITWYTSAGGGRTFSYTTEQALSAGLPDRVQCLPAPIDIRINLWNLNTQATDVSMGLSDDEVVEVVIDRFTFTSSNETGVGEGAYCSKDCQCNEGLICSGGFCALSDDV